MAPAVKTDNLRVLQTAIARRVTMVQPPQFEELEAYVTAEIAIMNQFGVALAADSAVTIGGQRVWNTASKVFSLGPCNDLGVMIYGRGDHAGIPWEVIIKDWRKSIGSHQFKTTDEAAVSFEDFLKGDLNISAYRQFVESSSFLLDALEKLKSSISGKNKPERKASLNALLDALQEFEEMAEPFDIDLDLDEFVDKQGMIVSQLAGDIFEFYISETLLTKLIAYCLDLCGRKIYGTRSSGIVIAGFGSSEHLPSLIEFRSDERIGESPRLWRVRERTIRDQSAVIIPFADKDEAVTFMEGISPDLNMFFESFFERVLHEKSESIAKALSSNDYERKIERELQRKDDQRILEGFREAFNKYKKEKFVDPSLQVVESLPKEEMASMAEALVETASLRKKVGAVLETVGGPIDVAVISKGDGFIWIRRKHYFDPKINPSFFYRKSAVSRNIQEGETE